MWTSGIFIWKRKKVFFKGKKINNETKVITISHSGLAIPAHTGVLWQWEIWWDGGADLPRWKKGAHMCWKNSEMVEGVSVTNCVKQISDHQEEWEVKKEDIMPHIKSEAKHYRIRKRDMMRSGQNSGKISFLDIASSVPQNMMVFFILIFSLFCPLFSILPRDFSLKLNVFKSCIDTITKSWRKSTHLFIQYMVLINTSSLE